MEVEASDFFNRREDLWRLVDWLESVVVRLYERIYGLAVILLVENPHIMLLLIQRGLNCVAFNVKFGRSRVIDHVVVFEHESRVVDGSREFLPVLDSELLDCLLMERRLLYRLAVR